MAGSEDREVALNALYRVIVYARNEAARLRIADAALLLGYAEDAVVTRDLAPADERARTPRARVPVVQH